jgi:hypothetical protein
MKYVVFMLMLLWLAHAMYQDWKDAHEARRQQGNRRSLGKLLQPKGFSNSGSGGFLLILGLAVITP